MKRRIRWENKNFDGMGTLTKKYELFAQCLLLQRDQQNIEKKKQVYCTHLTLSLLASTYAQV